MLRVQCPPGAWLLLLCGFGAAQTIHEFSCPLMVARETRSQPCQTTPQCTLSGKHSRAFRAMAEMSKFTGNEARCAVCGRGKETHDDLGNFCFHPSTPLPESKEREWSMAPYQVFTFQARVLVGAAIFWIAPFIFFFRRFNDFPVVRRRLLCAALVASAGYFLRFVGNASYFFSILGRREDWNGFREDVKTINPAEFTNFLNTQREEVERARATSNLSTSDHELAMLSQFIYDANSSDPVSLDRALLNMPSTWTVVAIETESLSGPGRAVLSRADTQEIVVVFRGTVKTNPTDWITDVSVGLIDHEIGDSNMEIHAGFLSQLWSREEKEKKRTSDEIWDAVEKAARPNSRLVYCGHSLGGALALTCKALHVPKSDLARRAEVVTFGAPLVFGDKSDDSLTKELEPRTRHYVYRYDIVPRLLMFRENYENATAARLEQQIKVSLSNTVSRKVTFGFLEEVEQRLDDFLRLLLKPKFARGVNTKREVKAFLEGNVFGFVNQNVARTLLSLGANYRSVGYICRLTVPDSLFALPGRFEQAVDDHSIKNYINATKDLFGVEVP